MKQKSILTLVFSVFFIFSLMAGATKTDTKAHVPKMPDNVKTIIEKSCFGCHNSGSKNDDAKEALDFKRFDGLSKIKKISAYKEIGETVDEADMPPEKFLNKFPEKKLTDKEKQVLLNWTKAEAKALVKGF